MAANLDSLPVERGMRLRGLAMTRLETFADAAFAFAVTLLVIAVDDVPRTFEELQVAIKSIPVFLFSAAQVFAFWIAHRNWSRIYGLDNGMAVLLTLLLVIGLLVMVFPLRIVYAFAVADLSDGWIPPPFELDPVIWAEQLILVFVGYGISWAWLAGIVVAIFGYVLVRRRTLALNATERRNAVIFLSMYGSSPSRACRRSPWRWRSRMNCCTWRDTSTSCCCPCPSSRSCCACGSEGRVRHRRARELRAVWPRIRPARALKLLVVRALRRAYNAPPFD